MAESTLSLTYTRLRRILGYRLGYGPDPTAWTAAQVTEVNDAIVAGQVRFYGEREWSFLRIPIQIPLYAPYETGTIAVASGVVTLTTGTFPSWAADGDLIYELAHPVSTRDGNTQVTLVDTSVTISSGASYSLVNSGYTLPDDFGGFVGSKLHYRPGDDGRSGVIITDVDHIKRLRFHDAHATDDPMYVAVEPKSSTGTTGQRFRLIWAPCPSDANRLVGHYRPILDALTSTIVYPYGGGLHSNTLIAACLHEAMQFDESYDGRYDARYQQFVQKSIEIDSGTSEPQSLGYDFGASESRESIDEYDHRSYFRPEIGQGTIET